MMIYIAGPMRNIEFFNFPAFDKAEELGKSLGHDIISPASMDRERGFDPIAHDPFAFDPLSDPDVRLRVSEMIVRDLIIITTCDAIALLPGWDKSLGVKVEFALAKFLGLQILDETFKPFNVEWNQMYVGMADPSLFQTEESIKEYLGAIHRK